MEQLLTGVKMEHTLPDCLLLKFKKLQPITTKKRFVLSGQKGVLYASCTVVSFETGQLPVSVCLSEQLEHPDKNPGFATNLLHALKHACWSELVRTFANGFSW